MAQTQVPIGLIKQDAGDGNWGPVMNNGIDAATARLTLSGVGSPTGVVAGHWVGQPYFDTSTNKVWLCKVATGAIATSVWVTIDNITSLSLAALTVASQILANGGLRINAGQRLVVPAGENSISNDAESPTTLDPFSHVARHRNQISTSHDALAWVNPAVAQFAPGILYHTVASVTGVSYSTTRAPITNWPAWTIAGRRGPSGAILLGLCNLSNATGTGGRYYVGIDDGSTLVTNSEKYEVSGAGTGSTTGHYAVGAFVTANANTTYRLTARHEFGPVTTDFLAIQLFLLDLGVLA